MIATPYEVAYVKYVRRQRALDQRLDNLRRQKAMLDQLIDIAFGEVQHVKHRASVCMSHMPEGKATSFCMGELQGERKLEVVNR